MAKRKRKAVAPRPTESDVVTVVALVAEPAGAPLLALHLAVRNVLLMARRPDGRGLADVAVAARVPGATLAIVRGVRAAMLAEGLIVRLEPWMAPDEYLQWWYT